MIKPESDKRWQQDAYGHPQTVREILAEKEAFYFPGIKFHRVY